MNRGRVARLVSGIGVAAVMGATVAAVEVLPAPVLASRSPAVLTVPPSITTLVCPGPVRLLTESDASVDLTYDPAFAPAPAGASSVARAVTLAPSSGDGKTGVAEWHPLGAGPGATLEPGGADAAVISESGLAAALVLTGAPVGAVPADLGAAVATTTPAGDLRGLAAAPCARPGTDLWLVGGSTELGSSARLVMQNPGATAATVTLEMWGADGPLALAGPRDFLVPPGSERAVLLEGVAAGQPTIAVHLVSAGGAVGAYLQDAALRGYVASGIDLVVPGSAPSVHQSVAGVALNGARVPGLASVVRLLAPGAVGARAALTVLGPAGAVHLPGAAQVELPPGIVTDVSLDGLPNGTYTVVVDSSAPVVASAMIVRSGTDPRGPIERAWAPAISTSAGGVIALPHGPNGAVVIGAPPTSATGDGALATGVLRAVDAQGGVVRTQTVRVPVGSTLVLRAADLVPSGDPAGVELLVDGGSALVLAVVLVVPLSNGAPGVSVLAALPPVDPTGPVTVRQDPTTGLRPPAKN